MKLTRIIRIIRNDLKTNTHHLENKEQSFFIKQRVAFTYLLGQLSTVDTIFGEFPPFYNDQLDRITKKYAKYIRSLFQTSLTCDRP